MKLKSILQEEALSKGKIQGRFNKIKGLNGNHQDIWRAKRLHDLITDLINTYYDMEERIFKGEVDKDALRRHKNALKDIQKASKQQAELFDSLWKQFDEKSIRDQMQKISDWVKGSQQ